ncbi:MAG TPA: trehalase family glycosidase [Candidatus Paceibacterota bacterium]|nr:trehalase family glycosidase [Verrucomicrobiota bacterium]HSA08772.1 trehalase family glycosidase [Candidatus Paceibacterota bacterium]
MTRRSFLARTALAAGGTACLLKSNWPAFAADAAKADPVGDLAALADSHDLRLPPWGPYTKIYNGLSHIADLERGLRFDLSVFPGRYRREVMVPNVNWESGFHPWEAAPDLSFFSYRCELEWKDRVYCDVSFSALSDRARLVRAELVNRTPAHQNLVLHFMASFNYPYVRPYTTEPAQKTAVQLPAGAVWVNALDYAELKFAQPRANDSLVPDGYRRAEVRDHGFVSGGGIGAGFGKGAGDRVRFRVRLRKALKDGRLLLRYRNTSNQPTLLEAGGLGHGELTLPPGKDFSLATLPLGAAKAGAHDLAFGVRKGAGIQLDGFAIVEAASAGAVQFQPAQFNWAPRILPGPLEHSRLLKYADAPAHYGLAWSPGVFQVREILNSELDRYFRRNVHDHVSTVLRGDGQGHFTNVFLRPIALAPESAKTVYGIVSAGTAEEVAEDLKQIARDPSELERSYRARQEGAAALASVPAGEPCRFSQKRMAAVVLTNIVFPVYGKRRYLRHYSPGKWWDSLYTWDSGFTGIGLAQLDVNRAIDCLNAYTTKPGDPETAFIHHGTPLPVQHYLCLELWNLTQSRALLDYFYPRLRQYHLFLAGRLGSSNTRAFKSGLLKTWSYFYNTGWDDYPPQVFMHKEKLAPRTATAIINSHLIRTARILAQMARVLGVVQDVAGYDEDIKLWSDALQTHSWDPDAGYFSYVLHDAQGQASGILRHESGANYNLGQDGVMPLLAGICTPAQERTLLGHLQSPRRLWTPIGLSTVDQSAPYYRHDGYWNGAVWMPHQWFLWKTMLDLGQAGFAFQIAQTALDLWRAEVDTSYHCFEHFLIESGRGAGWHQFGALSSPVLAWFAAYYRPGRLTTGFDTWIHRCDFEADNSALNAELELRPRPGGEATVLVTLQPGRAYRARWNGRPVTAHPALSGTLQIALPCDAGRGSLQVAPA